MKLAEAKNRIQEIEAKLLSLRSRLRVSPISAVVDVLDEINRNTTERQKLQMSLSDAESATVVAGNSLRDLAFTIEALDNRLATLTELKQRTDLAEEVVLNVFEQMDEFSKIRHKLKNSMEQTYWKIDLEVK